MENLTQRQQEIVKNLIQEFSSINAIDVPKSSNPLLDAIKERADIDKEFAECKLAKEANDVIYYNAMLADAQLLCEYLEEVGFTTELIINKDRNFRRNGSIDVEINHSGRRIRTIEIWLDCLEGKKIGGIHYLEGFAVGHKIRDNYSSYEGIYSSAVDFLNGKFKDLFKRNFC